MRNNELASKILEYQALPDAERLAVAAEQSQEAITMICDCLEGDVTERLKEKARSIQSCLVLASAIVEVEPMGGKINKQLKKRAARHRNSSR